MTAEAVVRQGDRVLDACCGTGDLAVADLRAGGDGNRTRLLAPDARARSAEVGRGRSGSKATCWRCRSRTDPSRRRPSGSASATSSTWSTASRSSRRVLVPGGRLAILEITTPTGLLAPFYRLWFDRIVPLLGKVLKGGEAYSYLPASVRRFPDRRGSGRAHAGGRVRRRRATARSPAGSSRCTRGRSDDRARHDSRDAGPRRLPRGARGAARGRPCAVVRGSSQPSRGTRSTPAASGCARCSSSSRPRPARRRPSPPGVAVELVHMATLVHDDLIDGAEFRRGRASAWSAYGPEAARATGDYLFARAFAELAATGDVQAVELLADAALCLARGEAMQRRQAHDPDTTVEAYLERCALKTAKLFEAACLLGSRADGLGRVRTRARDRVPDHRRHPRLRRRHDRDRQDRRRRSARGDADAAADSRRPRGRGRA